MVDQSKQLSSAKGIATRRNNRERKRLPLFADQLPVVTAEEVLEKRQQHRDAYEIWREEFDNLQARHLSERRARIAALVSDVEFAEIEAWVPLSHLDAGNAWAVAELKIKRRIVPMAENSMLVLAWLCEEDADLTVDELHKKRGDGLSRKEILDALLDLQDRGLAGGGVLRLCAIAGHDSAPWEATTAGREMNEGAGTA